MELALELIVDIPSGTNAFFSGLIVGDGIGVLKSWGWPVGEESSGCIPSSVAVILLMLLLFFG
jgi:hypothetical protein